MNDVALAAVSGGYRALLLERGDPLDQAVVRSLVPVSTRRHGGRQLSDNQVSCLLYELPVGIADPVERLGVVQEQMAELESLHISEAGVVVTSIADFVPPMVMGLLGRLALRSARSFGQHSLNTVTTNVPGPQIPLYCLGHEMLEYRPFVPISHGLRVGVAILSYNGVALLRGHRGPGDDAGYRGAGPRSVNGDRRTAAARTSRLMATADPTHSQEDARAHRGTVIARTGARHAVRPP